MTLRTAALFFFSCAVAIAAGTLIKDTLSDATGALANGSVSIRWTVPYSTASGKYIAGPGRIIIPVIAGKFVVTLEPTDTAVPAGVTYFVQYSFAGGATPTTEQWLVPTTAATLNITAVRSGSPPIPSVTIPLAQLYQQGATIGQGIVWNGSSYVPGNVGGGGASIWGSITGTLCNQTDLCTALAGKEPSLTFGPRLTRTVNAVDLTSGIVTPGSCGSTTQACGLSYDTYGRVTAATNNSISLAFGAGIPNLSGDIATAGSSVATIQPLSVNSSKMALVNVRRTTCLVIGADNASTALADLDLGPQTSQYLTNSAQTVTEISVRANASTPNVIIGRERSGATVNLTSAALSTAASGGFACANAAGTVSVNGVTTCSATLQNTTLAPGDWIALVSGTAGGVAKKMTACITVTVN